MHHQPTKEPNGLSQNVRAISTIVEVLTTRLVGWWHGLRFTQAVDDHL